MPWIKLETRVPDVVVYLQTESIGHIEQHRDGCNIYLRHGGLIASVDSPERVIDKAEQARMAEEEQRLFQTRNLFHNSLTDILFDFTERIKK